MPLVAAPNILTRYRIQQTYKQLMATMAKQLCAIGTSNHDMFYRGMALTLHSAPEGSCLHSRKP
jgi:hypothetical protein